MPLNSETFPKAAEFALRAAGLNACDVGIGIAVGNINSGINEIMDYACPQFKYVSLYSTEMNEASEIADRIFIKYGLAITVLSTDEFIKCRYPLKMDFNIGKLRLGRDLCIIGTDSAGILVRR